MEHQRANFYVILDKHISGLATKKKESFCMEQEKYNKMLSALSLEKGNSCQEGAKFKIWCNKNFKFEKIGSKNIVYLKKSNKPMVTR